MLQGHNFKINFIPWGRGRGGEVTDISKEGRVIVPL